MKITIKQPKHITGKLYDNSTFDFAEGLTVLTGCNGSGKSTLLEELHKYADEHNIPNYLYDARKSQENLGREFQNNGDIDVITQCIAHNMESEGENLHSSFGYFLTAIGTVVRLAKPGDDIIIMIDGIDSGVSINLIRDIKDFLLNTMLAKENIPADTHMYVIVSANSFELARDCDCIDVSTAKHKTFNNYDEYVDYIVESAKRWDVRVNG
jgi:energy-coupling factor transporter ATP-binding protein EcfA2